MAQGIKLPKQWKHWARTNGLKPHGRAYKRPSDWHNLVGRGRVWRIAYDWDGVRGHWFQGGARTQDFDRWALSVRYDFAIPQTLAQFTAAVRSLKDAA